MLEEEFPWLLDVQLEVELEERLYLQGVIDKELLKGKDIMLRIVYWEDFPKPTTFSFLTSNKESYIFPYPYSGDEHIVNGHLSSKERDELVTLAESIIEYIQELV